MRGNNFGWIIVGLYLLFGLYFLNIFFSVYTLPSFFSDLEVWIALVTGVLLIWGGVNHKRASRKLY